MPTRRATRSLQGGLTLTPLVTKRRIRGTLLIGAAALAAARGLYLKRTATTVTLEDFLGRAPSLDPENHARASQSVAVVPLFELGPRVAVVGLGGAGRNVVRHLVDIGLPGAKFITFGTYTSQELWPELGRGHTHVHGEIAPTPGLDGGDPARGARAAEGSAEELRELLRGVDAVLVTAGLGGNTGTGSAPVVARIAREAGAFPVGIATSPFGFEGHRRRQTAEDGLAAFRREVDTLVVIPCDGLLSILDRGATVAMAFQALDEVVSRAVRAIAEFGLGPPGLITIDFADVRCLMQMPPDYLGMIGIGGSSGEGRAVEAARAALSSQFLALPIESARLVLLSVRGGPTFTLDEGFKAAKVVADAVGTRQNPHILRAMRVDPQLGEAVEVTLIAFSHDSAPRSA